MRPQCIIYHFVKDTQRNVLVMDVYEAVSKEFYDEPKEFDLALGLGAIAAKVFKVPFMRYRLANWRGFGNEKELYIAYEENDLKEVEWFAKDCTLLNGARITSNLSFLDRESLRQEVKDTYRNSHGFGRFEDLH